MPAKPAAKMAARQQRGSWGGRNAPRAERNPRALDLSPRGDGSSFPMNRTLVAQQVSNLPYRRLPVGQTPDGPSTCRLEIQDTAQRGAGATKVAQRCTLPYRRFAIGLPLGVTHRPTRPSPPQHTILRYSRYQICATRYRHVARGPERVR